MNLPQHECSGPTRHRVQRGGVSSLASPCFLTYGAALVCQCIQIRDGGEFPKMQGIAGYYSRRQRREGVASLKAVHAARGSAPGCDPVRLTPAVKARQTHSVNLSLASACFHSCKDYRAAPRCADAASSSRRNRPGHHCSAVGAASVGITATSQDRSRLQSSRVTGLRCSTACARARTEGVDVACMISYAQLNTNSPLGLQTSACSPLSQLPLPQSKVSAAADNQIFLFVRGQVPR